MKNNIHIIIDPRINESHHYYGFLRSIPLIKALDVENFTFISSLNIVFPPPFNFNFSLLNKESKFSSLSGKICQIINQSQEYESEHNLTFSLYKECINSNTKLDKIYFVFDDVRFKLKFDNNREDKPFVEDKGLINIVNYEDLLRNKLRKEGIKKLPLSISKKSGNYVIQKMAQNHYEKTGKKISFLSDLFDFNLIHPESEAWDMLIFFSKITNSLNYSEIINRSLKLFIENDITKICENFYDALKSKNFDYVKIIKWRNNINECYK